MLNRRSLFVWWICPEYGPGSWMKNWVIGPCLLFLLQTLTDRVPIVLQHLIMFRLSNNLQVELNDILTNTRDPRGERWRWWLQLPSFSKLFQEKVTFVNKIYLPARPYSIKTRKKNFAHFYLHQLQQRTIPKSMDTWIPITQYFSQIYIGLHIIVTLERLNFPLIGSLQNL